MYSFKNDYSEGCHPNILQKLIDTNLIQQPGYGEDHFTSEAKTAIRNMIGDADAAVFFLSGGTQTNLIVISSILRTHEAVISAKTGHIYANETGAIESKGHRIITVDGKNGKLRTIDIETVLTEYALRPHVVKPKMVYISNSTEIGTTYSKEELKDLSLFCRSHDLYLFLDGARLGHALTAEGNDLTMADIAELTDVFYIGGTKNGALLGEAVVFTNINLAEDFDYKLKQNGALLAKGRILGIQFSELFRDQLYFSLARKANKMAQKITKALQEKGYGFLTDSKTNQIFPILPNKIISEIEKKYDFYVWRKIDQDTSAIRIITSWATNEQKVEEFISDLIV